MRITHFPEQFLVIFKVTRNTSGGNRRSLKKSITSAHTNIRAPSLSWFPMFVGAAKFVSPSIPAVQLDVSESCVLRSAKYHRWCFPYKYSTLNSAVLQLFISFVRSSNKANFIYLFTIAPEGPDV